MSLESIYKLGVEENEMKKKQKKVISEFIQPRFKNIETIDEYKEAKRKLNKDMMNANDEWDGIYPSWIEMHLLLLVNSLREKDA